MNVYDCFYYNSSEISAEAVKETITEEAFKLYDDLFENEESRQEKKLEKVLVRELIVQ